MNKHEEGLDNEFWSKKILYFYWLLAIISLGGQLVGLLVTFLDYPDYITEYISLRTLYPSSILLGIMVICELMVRVLKIYNPYILLFTGTLLALTMILGNPALTGMQLTLLLPMAISLIYFRKVKLLYSFAINLSGLLSVYFLSEAIRAEMTPYEYFAYPFILCGGYVVYLAVIERGLEVMRFLKMAAQKEEELTIQNKVMERLAKTDALTGLYNHKTFQEYLEMLVSKAKNSHAPLQLAMLDIDNFKKINDNFGHSTGDLVLKKVAETIREKVTEHDVTARYGGEEFAVLLTEKSFSESYFLLEEIRKSIAELEYPGIMDKQVTISIGLQEFKPDMDKSILFKKADALLYEAKKSGKNIVVHNGRSQSYDYEPII